MPVRVGQQQLDLLEELRELAGGVVRGGHEHLWIGDARIEVLGVDAVGRLAVFRIVELELYKGNVTVTGRSSGSGIGSGRRGGRAPAGGGSRPSVATTTNMRMQTRMQTRMRMQMQMGQGDGHGNGNGN